MKMKKLLTLALAGVMSLSMCATAFAADITTDGGSGETVVTYGTDESFIVTIPTDFTIDAATNKAVAEVSATEVIISAKSVLKVAVTGSDYVDAWELIDQAEVDNKLVYTIGTTEGGTDIVSGTVVLDVDAGEAPDSTEVVEKMYFTVTDTLTKAGTYTDTLTFTVSVEDKVKLINFRIEIRDDGSLFGTGTCEEGMTWEEYLYSDYFGSPSFMIYDDGSVEIGDTIKSDIDGTTVHKDDVIIDGKTYYVG